MALRTETGLDAATHRQVGVALFNRTWDLLEMEGRTHQQDVELVHSVHASAFHWMQVGSAVNRVRSEWQCSRVYSSLGRPVAALWHAREALAICDREGIDGFDLGYAYEGVARALAVAGNHDEAAHWVEQARTAAAAVDEDDHRELLLSDLHTVPRALS